MLFILQVHKTVTQPKARKTKQPKRSSERQQNKKLHQADSDESSDEDDSAEDDMPLSSLLLKKNGKKSLKTGSVSPSSSSSPTTLVTAQQQDEDFSSDESVEETWSQGKLIRVTKKSEVFFAAAQRIAKLKEEPNKMQKQKRARVKTKVTGDGGIRANADSRDERSKRRSEKAAQNSYGVVTPQPPSFISGPKALPQENSFVNLNQFYESDVSTLSPSPDEIQLISSPPEEQSRYGEDVQAFFHFLQEVSQKRKRETWE